MALTLKQIQDKMVPASAKAGKAIDSQWLSPSSFDKKLVKSTFGSEVEYNDPDEDEKINFHHQDKIKKNTKAPVVEADDAIANGTYGHAVYEAYEEESLDLLEEIMELVEDDGAISGYYWKDVAANLKNVRDCLLNNVTVKESLDENFKQGSFKLKDGSKVTLDKNDVKVLNNALAGTKSQEKMLSSAIKNQQEFHNFLDFAKSLHENYDLTVDMLLDEASIEDLELIAENDLAEGDAWNVIKGGAMAGATVGKHVGATVGAVGGGLYGGGIAASAVGASKLLKVAKNIKNKRRGDSASSETNSGNVKPYNPEDAKVSPGESKKNPLKEDEVTASRVTPNNKKKSIVGTSAPALDSDPNMDRDNSNNKITESGGLGGHPANYRNPAEGKFKFAKIEPSKKLDYYIITPHDVIGKAPKKEGDIFTVKVDRGTTTQLTLIKTVDNRFYGKPLKEEIDLQEISKEKTKKYLDKAITDHGHSNFAKNNTEPGSKAYEYWSKKAKNRKKGISKAIDKLEK